MQRQHSRLESNQTTNNKASGLEKQSHIGQKSRSTARSLLRHAPLLVLSLIILANRWQKTDPDLWGHIRFGQVMLSSGQIVSHDQYSYTAFGSSWRDHEYLTEIIMAVVYNAAGVVGLKVWKFLCIAATVLFLAIGLAEADASCLVQLNMLAVTAVILAPYVQFRPQAHTFALFALTVALLAAESYRGSAPLWLMIPAMALWSNLHGGFIIGLITLVSYTGVVGLRDSLNSRGPSRACKLSAITGAAIVATLLPPGGLNSWCALLTAVCNPLTFKVIADWQPLSVALQAQWQSNPYFIISDLFLFALWAALLPAIWRRPFKRDFPLVFIALLMSIAAVKSVRNVPLAAIACVIPATRQLGLLLSGAMKEREEVTLSHWLQWLVFGAVLVFTSQEVFSSQLPTDMAYPSAAVAFMKQHRLRGNVLAYFAWVEYLIWHLAPASKVFVDGRYDTVYPLRVIQDYLTFYWDLPGADKVLRTYAHDFILIPPDEKPYKRIIGIPGWKLIYRDSKSALFARSDSQAAQLPGIPLTGRSPALQYFP
jgi:hypothetical protein